MSLGEHLLIAIYKLDINKLAIDAEFDESIAFLAFVIHREALL